MPEVVTVTVAVLEPVKVIVIFEVPAGNPSKLPEAWTTILPDSGQIGVPGVALGGSTRSVMVLVTLTSIGYELVPSAIVPLMFVVDVPFRTCGPEIRPLRVISC